MVRKFEDAVKISIATYEKERALLPSKLGNEAMNHFKDSWRKQGFEDTYISPWKIRKNKDRSRAILVKTGNLRRAFGMTTAIDRATITNDSPYGFYHNYGTNKLPMRKFMGFSRVLDNKSVDIIVKAIKRALQ